MPGQDQYGFPKRATVTPVLIGQFGLLPAFSSVTEGVLWAVPIQGRLFLPPRGIRVTWGGVVNDTSVLGAGGNNIVTVKLRVGGLAGTALASWAITTFTAPGCPPVGANIGNNAPFSGAASISAVSRNLQALHQSMLWAGGPAAPTAGLSGNYARTTAAQDAEALFQLVLTAVIVNGNAPPPTIVHERASVELF